MTILILFHSGGYKNLKYFYIFTVQKHMKKGFSEIVVYNHFIELQKKPSINLQEDIINMKRIAA